ncbi:MAG: peptidoglycan DD-metalloendopeptidase family protein [Bdellovibrionota bacterium]
MIDFSRFQFHPVIPLPPDFEVFDFTRGYDPTRQLTSSYGIGRYNEDRRGMYDAALFQGQEGARTIHMGIDIGAPVGTPVHAFYEGEIFLTGYNGAEGDYGNTVITRHSLDGQELFALHGHLSAQSIQARKIGDKFLAGDVIAWVGDRHENGGWNPHLHFQLSLERPEKCDMPGVVNEAQREQALRIYPDPRLVLGALY